MALNYVTLTGDLPGAGGGTVSFTPSNWLTDASDELLIPPAQVTVTLSAAGTFSVKLLATDNSAPVPAGWYWTVTISGITGVAADSFSFFLPYTGGATQDISALAPVSSPAVLAAAAVPGVYIAPSGDTTGATDQAAITALETLGSKTIYFAAGTFWVTGLVKQANTIWQGAGRFQTIIKLASGSDTDVVQGAGFTSLTLSGSTTGGIGGWGIRDLTIDGNSAGQSGTSHGLRVYGYEFDLTRVTIRDCLSTGLYTEWSSTAGSTPDDTMGANYTGLVIHGCGLHGWHNRGPHDSRAYDITIFGNGTGSYGYWGESTPANTTVASGSNGVNVSTFTGSGVLNVASTLNFASASVSASQGSLTAATSGGTAVITYTGVTAQTFTGCTTVSGSGTLSTGGTVAPSGVFSSAGMLLEGVHVYLSPLWDFVLDTQTHLIDCVGEVAQSSGGMVLVRAGLCQILGGVYIIYSEYTPEGCGIQIGDTANACTGLRADTLISGLTGSAAATAALSIVNDNGGNAVDAEIYQPSGTPVYGTPNATSRYRIASSGASVANNAANSLIQDFGQTRIYIPPSNALAWRLTPAGGTSDAVNYSSNTNIWAFNNGILLQGWSGAYSGSTWQLDLSKGHMLWPSTTAPSGAITSAVGTAGNGAAVTVTGNDRRGKITITTASTGLGGSWPATAANFTFANAYGSAPRVVLTPWDGPSAAVLPYCQAFSATEFLVGFAVAPAESATYSYTYVVEG